MRREITVARTVAAVSALLSLRLLLRPLILRPLLLNRCSLLRLLLNGRIWILRRPNDRPRRHVLLLRSLRLTPEKRSDVHRASFRRRSAHCDLNRFQVVMAASSAIRPRLSLLVVGLTGPRRILAIAGRHE
jgi:hypothetical protein